MQSENILISLLIVVGILAVMFWLSRELYYFLSTILYQLRYHWLPLFGALCVLTILISFAIQRRA
ncbi:MAG: hypothetical protein ACK4QL_03140 [Pseudanabaenaceae cyanobacterium]